MKLLASVLASALPAVGSAQLPYHLIATNGAAMSYAFDGSNYLVGLQNPTTNYALLTPSNGISAQMMSATGAKVGSLIAIPRSGIATCVAFDGTNYLMIWEDDGLGTLNGNTGWQICGQFISRTGTMVGSPFAISTTGIWFDGIKTMAFGGGKYLVTYTRLIVPANGDQWNNRYIAGRIVSPDGSMGDEIRVSSGYGKASDVAFDGVNFFVVWCEDAADTEIRGRFVSPTGLPGAEISINASAAPSDNPKSVAFNGANYLVVWNDEVGGSGTWTWDCFGQLVSTSGALVGGVISITTDPGPQMIASVASDGVGFFAVWMDMSGVDWDTYGQYISGAGGLLGGKVALSTAAGNQMGGVGFANGRYLILANNGMIMGDGGISQVDSAAGAFIAPWTNPQFATSDSSFGIRTNRFGFTITGPEGAVVVVEACTDLSGHAWSSVSTNIITGGSSYFGDPEWANYRDRFYRLILR